MKKLMILFILLLIPHLVLAGVISLTTTVSTDIMTEDSTKTHVKLINSGDEAAYNVKISLLTDNFETDFISIDELHPNIPFEGNLSINLKKKIIPGNYPLIVLTDYADANGYPFSSISPSFLVYKNRTNSKILAIIPEITLSGQESKELRVIIKNLDDVSHDVEVKLMLPRELKATETEKTVSLTSKEEKTLNSEVSSFSALPGSSYVVLASLEYEDDLHYSSFGTGIVRIVEKTSFVELPDWLPIIILIALVLILIFYQFKGRKK